MPTIRHATTGRTKNLLWDYFLITQPDDPVSEKIRNEQQHFSEHYHPQTPARPHIAIAHFQAKEAMEETLIRWIQNICRLQHRFKVTLLNFSGSIPFSISLPVQDPKPFMQLTNSLKILNGFIQSNECPPLCVETHPHLTLAGNLPQPVYEQAKQEYPRRSFQASFAVEKLLLVRRDGSAGSCQLVNTFTLPPAHLN